MKITRLNRTERICAGIAIVIILVLGLVVARPNLPHLTPATNMIAGTTD